MIKKNIIFLFIQIISIIFFLLIMIFVSYDMAIKPNKTIYTGKVNKVYYLQRGSLFSENRTIVEFESGKKFNISGFYNFEHKCAIIKTKYQNENILQVVFFECKKNKML